jgi:type IV pilus assembly protein PilA
MKRSIQKGFTLIELMIVVAIIGILAAVALPAYQDYTTRAKVSEMILAASAGRTSLSEAYAANGKFPPDTSSADYVATQSSKYVSGVSYAIASSNAVITVTGRNLGNSAADGKKLKLTGVGDASAGTVTWTCTPDDMPAKYLPATCR